jgi:hypothetical protein
VTWVAVPIHIDVEGFENPKVEVLPVISAKSLDLTIGLNVIRSKRSKHHNGNDVVASKKIMMFAKYSSKVSM